MKEYSVSAFFTEVKPAHAAIQVVRVRAASLPTALFCALTEITAREAIKGKQITEVRLDVAVINDRSPK